jgi:hypothetical protein
MAVPLARMRVVKISEGYAHESGPMQALKKKLKIHVLTRGQQVQLHSVKNNLRDCKDEGEAATR